MEQAINGRGFGKIRKAANWIVGRSCERRIIEMPLEEQVKVIRRWLTFPGVIVESVHKDLVVVDLPNHIRGKINAGESQEAIKAYYWDCEPFRQLWLDMKLDEATLDKLIKEAFLDYVTKP